MITKDPMIFTIVVKWDDEAKVFWATSADIPGLVVEAEKFDILVAKVKSVAPILLRENAVEVDEDGGDMDLDFIGSHRVSFGMNGAGVHA